MTGMTKRARVMAALAGERVDRVPLAFWMHNFATENSADGLAGETLRLARTFDWDYLKPQSRAQCFAEMWGLRYRASTERATPFRSPARRPGTPRTWPACAPSIPVTVRSASSWRRSEPSAPRSTTRRSSGPSAHR